MDEDTLDKETTAQADAVPQARQLRQNPAQHPRKIRSGVAQATVAVLQRMIAEGQLPAGSPVPPEREFASDLSVSRATLREALSILATMGLLSIQPGRGTFVRALSPDDEVGASTTFWPANAASYLATEVYQFRYIVESYASQLAAMKHTDQDILQLQNNLEAFRRATGDGDFALYTRLDFDFHGLIIKCSGNRIIGDLHDALENVVLESHRLPLTHRATLWDAVVEHERIVEALAMNDPEGAGYYMRQHISRSSSRAGITITELV